MDSLSAILEQFQVLQKLSAVVADNAANVLGLATLLNARFRTTFPGFLEFQFSCVCHVLNLIVKKLQTNTMGFACEEEEEQDDFQFSLSTAPQLIAQYTALMKKCLVLIKIILF